MKTLTFRSRDKMCMNTSRNELETLKVLRLIEIYLFFFCNQIPLYHGVTQGGVTIRKFRMLQYFRNERRHGTGYLNKKIN